MTAPGAPVLVLGVRRSGTTLLRVMLDRSPELAVPDESYFVPQLARRHHGPVDVDAFLDDLRRLPTLVEWGVSADAVAPRLLPARPEWAEHFASGGAPTPPAAVVTWMPSIDDLHRRRVELLVVRTQVAWCG